MRLKIGKGHDNIRIFINDEEIDLDSLEFKLDLEGDLMITQACVKDRRAIDRNHKFTKIINEKGD